METTSSDKRAASRDLAASPKQSTARRNLSVSVVNFWIDVLTALLLAVLGTVSAILQFVFPAPALADGWTLWSLTYDQWRDIQFGSLCLFALAVILHVMMHWNWVCSVVTAQIVKTHRRPDDGLQTIYGVATLILLLHLVAACVIAALLTVRPPGP